MAKIDEFRAELNHQFRHAEQAGLLEIEINSGKLHRKIGGYPGRSHYMPICCDAMYEVQHSGDQIVAQPPKGKGATLTIRYKLPR